MNNFFLSGLICIMFYLFIKDDGIIDYYREKESYQELVIEKNQLEQELQAIKDKNRLLKNNKRYIEKVAREEYFYIFPDEIIISLE